MREFVFVVCSFPGLIWKAIQKTQERRCCSINTRVEGSTGGSREGDGLDEREWWVSTSTWLRMRGFTLSHSRTSTTDRHTQWDTYTPETLPSYSAISSPRVLWHSWRKWSGIAGVSYFSAVSGQVFSSSLIGLCAAFNPGSLGGRGQVWCWWLCEWPQLKVPPVNGGRAC